jgi:hypothetical protein
MNDRNGSCGSLGGLGCRCCDDYDGVDIYTNHLVRILLEAVRMALCIPALDDEVSTFLVSEFSETSKQGIIKFLVSVGDEPDPPNLARLLRSGT